MVPQLHQHQLPIPSMMSHRFATVAEEEQAP
jgi:hypothetical protein